MKNRIRKAAVLAIVFILALAVQGYRPAPGNIEPEPRTSPYFMVEDKSDVESFPLLSTSAQVKIAGMSADTVLTQVYKNSGKKTIEAIYVFPLGTKTAIHAMRMKIGDRITEAEINEKEEARKIYQKAKDDGKVASLLEQKRPNVFQMKVANIMPGDKVEVSVIYNEALVPENSVYGFVFPTVAGPRFTGESDKSESWTASPYRHSGEEPDYTFNIDVSLETGIPVSKVWSPSHRVSVEKGGAGLAKVSLLGNDAKKGNKDFILRYNLAGNKIQSGVILYNGEKENYFLMMMEPPDRVEESMIPQREYLFIVDVSGSMHGFPLDVSKKLMNEILDGLDNRDYFNILFFAGGSNTLFPHAFPATKSNKKKAIDMMNSQRGSGGTQILNAMNNALKLEKKEGVSRTVVVVTDGYISVEKKVFDLMREKMGGCNFFTFGIGSSVNRYLIEGMARVGKGEPFVVTDKSEADRTAKKFVDLVKSPLLTDIKVSFKGFDAYDIEPPSMPDLFAKRPLVMFGKYKKAKGKIVITGKSGGRDYENVIKIGSSMESSENSALKYLWAREKIARLGDYKSVGVDGKKEITELGLKYSLMTEYTSFVAVDKIKRETGEVVTVKQPLPLPEGVSDYAVGGSGALGVKRSANYYSPAPGFPAKSKYMGKAADMVACEEAASPKIQPIHQAAASGTLYMSGIKAPAGMSTDDVETAIFGAIKQEIKNLMAAKGLSKLTVEVEFRKGSIVKVNAKTGGKYAKEIEKLFKKVKTRNGNLNGKVTVSLLYMP